MPSDQTLCPATAQEIGNVLAKALSSGEREQSGESVRFLALLAAERLLQLLEQAGFVVMKQLSAAPKRPRSAG